MPLTCTTSAAICRPVFPRASTPFRLPAGQYTTDPRAFYDWVNHRFVFVMITDTDRCQSDDVSSLLIAASETH